MKLEHPLANLVARCETICVAQCCGIDAYDFSPVQLASGLTMYRGLPDPAELRRVRGQIAALKANYGAAGASARGATLEDMNQTFTAEQIDALADELSANLEVALALIEQSERLRYSTAEPAPAPGGSAAGEGQ